MIVSSSFTVAQGLKFQEALMSLQMSLEECYYNLGLLSGKPNVAILIDRGLMDGSAYVSQDQWQALLDDNNLNEQVLRDNRYEGIIHLVTAADGAPDFYLIDDPETNEARYEGIEEAIEKDKRIRQAYYPHQKWFLIGNDVNNFKEKINKAKDAVYDILSLPVGANFFKKFILKKQKNNDPGVRSTVPIDFAKLPEYQQHEMVIDYVHYTSKEKVVNSNVTKKGRNDSYNYTHEVTIEKKGKLITKKRNISAQEYFDLLALKDEERESIKKIRVCGAIEEIYFIIDFFESVPGQPVLLILQVSEKDLQETGRVKIPQVFKIYREVTDQVEYQPYMMARKDYEMIKTDNENTNMSD